MAEDIRDKLRRQLTGATPKGLPGQESRRLVDKGTGPAPEEKKVPMYMPVDVYLMTDATNSMEPVIDAVKKGLGDIARELFTTPERGEVSISVGYVGDHYKQVSDADYHSRVLLGHRPRNLVPAPATSFLQIYPLSSNLGQLEQAITRIPTIPNTDTAEAYECAWLEVSKRMISKRRLGVKRVAVFFGDSIPHGLPGLDGIYVESSGSAGRTDLTDFGCPNNIDPLTAWRALAAASDLSLFVGCSEYGTGFSQHKDKGYGVDTLQRKIVEAARGEIDTSKFVSLQDVGDIPALIMAGTRLAQSEAAFREYAQRQLTDSGRRDRIAGYLEMKKP